MAIRQQRVNDSVAVVTGAAGGLGRQLVRGLLAEGVRVAGIGRRRKQLEALASELNSSYFLPVATDISDENQVECSFSYITGHFGPVTLLINNAAVYPRRDILDETPESFMETIRINLGGTFSCCHYVLSGMIKAGSGRIINVSSFADLKPIPFSSSYSVSKGAQRILTRALLADLGGRFPDIIINDWIPGALNTSMGIPEGISPETAAQWGVRLALWHDRSLQGVTFAKDQEQLEHLSLKRKLIMRALGQRRIPRRLSG
jgi:3-oxoacyl-[acyl-carrier protein] reductase